MHMLYVDTHVSEIMLFLLTCQPILSDMIPQYYHNIQGSKIRSESWESEDNQNLKSGSPRHYFSCPYFVTLLYVCGTSSHTAVLVGKRKIT